MQVEQHYTAVVLGVLLSGVSACSNGFGPDVPEGALLAAASLALEWSADGQEILYYDSGFTGSQPRPVPDRILAVNVRTRATRVVVPSGSYGAAGGERPGAVPPRATIAGLAYVRVVGEQFVLQLVTESSDVPLAASGGWFTSTPDRTRLLYNFPTRDAFNDSIAMIDLGTGARTVFRTGAYGPVTGAAVSPDGNDLLVERLDASAGFAILSLQDGAITALDDSSLFPDRHWFSPIPLGWNATGVWFAVPGGPPRLVRYDPVTRTGQAFPVSNVPVGTRALTGGTALPMGGILVWEQNCNSTDPMSGACTQAAYAAWLMNPLAGVDDQLVSVNTSPAFDYPRAMFAAASPDGGRLAYVLGNELRILPLR